MVIGSRLLATLAALATLGAGASAQAQNAPPPPLEAYGDLPAVEEAAMSPSGKHIAIVSMIKGERKLLLLDTAMKLVRQSTIGELKVRGIQWIGDEAALLTYSETEDLGPMDFVNDKYERFRGLIVPLDPAAKSELVFSGNSSIVTTLRGIYGIRHVGNEWMGYFGGIRLANSMAVGRYIETTKATLFEVRLRDNEARSLADPAEGNLERKWLIDADGKVAATFDIDENLGDWRIENGRGKLLAKGRSADGNVDLVGLGKDGTTLIYAIKQPGSEIGQWYEATLDGAGEPVEVFEDIAFDGYFIEPTTGRLIGFIDDDKRSFLDPAIQQMSDKIARAFRGLHVELQGWTPDFGHVLVKTSGSTDSGTWFMVDLKALKADAIGVERPQIAASQVGVVSSLSYKASDGLAMDGVLTLPPARAAKNLPLIVLPHGGPASHDEVIFDWWAQAFASRGYAVFQPNFRGSTGRGDAFLDAGDGEWGRKMQSDISDGVAVLAAAGTIDPKRACIVGASYGGYAALAGVTLQQGLYRCAVAVAPVSDLPLMYDSWYANGGGGNVTKAALLAQLGPLSSLDAVSPRRFAARADAPILLIHGKDDTVVPFDQSTKMADALRDAHKDVELVELNGEDHWLSRSATRNQMLAAAMKFVLKHNPPD